MFNFLKNKTLIFVLIILITSSFTRLYKLGSLPEAFAADEAALAYNGWSILTTARDEWGKFLPLELRSFDDNKPALYSYLTIPGIAVFGINKMSARLPAAIFGILLCLSVFFFVKTFTKNHLLAFITSMIIVVSPWHIEISRTAIEAGVALSISMLGLIGLSSKRSRWRWIGLFLILMTMFTYHTARVVVPFVALFGVITKSFQLEKKQIFTVILLIFLGISLSVTESSMRFSQISIFSDQQAKIDRTEAIYEDGDYHTSVLLTRILHNKPWSWAYTFADSYLTNTSLKFLFWGGAQPPRVTIPETGQFLIILLPFFMYGLFSIARSWQPFERWIILWLIFAPVPVALTTAEIPHTYRTLFMLPSIAFIIAMGIYSFVKLIRKINFKLAFSTAIILTMFIAAFFFKSWHQYVVHQQLHQPWYRQYGYEHMITYLNNLENKQKIIMTNREGEPYIFILFFNKIKPLVYQKWPQKRLAHVDIDHGKKQWEMFNYVFHEQDCPYDMNDHNPNNIYVVHFICKLPKGYERIKRINFMDGNPEFFIDRPLMIKKTDI